MNTETTRQSIPPGPLTHGYDGSAAVAPDETLAHEQAVDAILDDCFLSIGQGIGLRARLAARRSTEGDALAWWSARWPK